MIIYFILISVIAAVVTLYDKIVSKEKSKQRVSEKTLILIAFMGGALFMYVTMKIIRHKTKHAKFMIGIPSIILGQVGLIFVAIYLNGRM